MPLGHLFLDNIGNSPRVIGLETTALSRLCFAKVLLGFSLTAHFTGVIGVLNQFAWLRILNRWSFILK